jgi:hypothetical protein
MTELIKYEAAKRAIAEARRVDEAKEINDEAKSMEAYARQAKDRQMEADAHEIRMRAERKVGELIKKQKQTIGLSEGGKPQQKNVGKTGLFDNPVTEKQKTTFAEAGIDKNLAHRAREAARLSEEEFEEKIEQEKNHIVNKDFKSENPILVGEIITVEKPIKYVSDSKFESLQDKLIKRVADAAELMAEITIIMEENKLLKPNAEFIRFLRIWKMRIDDLSKVLKW